MRRQKRHAGLLNPWQAKQAILKRLGVDISSIVIFDVGASVGKTVDKYRMFFPKAKIYCFEPLTECVSKLHQKFGRDPNIEVFPVAMAASNGVRPYYYGGPDGGWSSLLTGDKFLWRYTPHELSVYGNVPTVTLDYFCKNEGIDHIHVLKMDVQGGEARLLAGADRMLQSQEIDIVYSEILFVPMYKGAALFCDLQSMMHSRGYSLFDLYYLGRCSTSRQLMCGDAVFVSNKVRKRVLDPIPPKWMDKSQKERLGRGRSRG